MSTETYSQLLYKPEELKNEQVSELKSIIKEYPFFQSARALYLKGLKNQDSFRYNNELKTTAAYTTDRAVLFDFITSKNFQNKADIHQQISEKISKEEPAVAVKEIEVIEKELDLGKPIDFNSKEAHSFNEWLQLAARKPIVRKEEKKLDKFQLIDRFIENNPKINPVDKGEKVDIDIPKNKVDKSLMTETLAKVYLEQKKFSKAIKAYEILSLKYPEKSGFFADQIKRIRILQKNKS
ncbi:hypothetical protein AAON49_13435 [Pseudotenacibaculum sp. MALMAid0570]|uniref:hypothetical protein n=1 Tax=Pseudotenacibaculum sp. MALMAid0570 TaxID=3143938 RepID=UPI0032DF12F4